MCRILKILASIPVIGSDILVSRGIHNSFKHIHCNIVKYNA